MSEKKIFVLGASVTALLFIGGIALLSQPKEAAVTTPVGVGVIETDPAFYDLGEVAMKDGNVTREYSVKNTSGQTLKLKKIVTSCMCTEAKVSVNGKESRFFGMEGHGDRNAPVNMEIPVGAEATVVVVFDPAAHGPQGVGPFDRVVTLTFSDPVGIVELRFSGTVI